MSPSGPQSGVTNGSQTHLVKLGRIIGATKGKREMSPIWGRASCKCWLLLSSVIGAMSHLVCIPSMIRKDHRQSGRAHTSSAWPLVPPRLHWSILLCQGSRACV